MSPTQLQVVTDLQKLLSVQGAACRSRCQWNHLKSATATACRDRSSRCCHRFVQRVHEDTGGGDCPLSCVLDTECLPRGGS